MIKFKFFLGILLLLSTGWLLNILELNQTFILIFRYYFDFSIFKGKFKKQLFLLSLSVIFFASILIHLNKVGKLKWEMFNESKIYDHINNNKIVF